MRGRRRRTAAAAVTSSSTNSPMVTRSWSDARFFRASAGMMDGGRSVAARLPASSRARSARQRTSARRWSAGSCSALPPGHVTRSTASYPRTDRGSRSAVVSAVQSDALPESGNRIRDAEREGRVGRQGAHGQVGGREHTAVVLKRDGHRAGDAHRVQVEVETLARAGRNGYRPLRRRIAPVHDQHARRRLAGCVDGDAHRRPATGLGDAPRPGDPGQRERTGDGRRRRAGEKSHDGPRAHDGRHASGVRLAGGHRASTATAGSPAVPTW